MACNYLKRAVPTTTCLESDHCAGDVTWEIHQVSLCVDQEKVFNQAGDLWIRVTGRDASGSRSLSVISDSMMSVLNIKVAQELVDVAKAGELETCCATGVFSDEMLTK